jgi:hypothetical protein
LTLVPRAGQAAAPLQTTLFLHEKDDDHPRPMAWNRNVLCWDGKERRRQWSSPVGAAASRPMDPP